MDLAPAALMAHAAKLSGDFARERQSAGALRLITKREVKTHNSWTHNYAGFVERRDTNHLYMHPEDAGERGLSEGELVDVSSTVGTVRLPLALLPDLMPGTVAMPHGWGHQHTRTSVASRTRGVNVNILSADGPQSLERVSGMARLTGYPVQVRKAAGPQQPTWSGM